SGEIFTKPDLFLGIRTIVDGHTAIKSELMPTEVSYSHLVDLEIPEIFLPFIKYSVEVKPVPDTEVHALYSYIPSSWAGDDIRVEGDGLLIWKGTPLVTYQQNLNIYFLTHSTDVLLAKGISLSLTKETWNVDFEADREGGINVVGKILGLQGTEILSENSCLTNDDTKVFNISHSGNKNHKITSFTDAGFEGIGDETITTYTDDGEGGCDQNIVINSNVTRTINFASIDTYRLTVAQPQSIGLGYNKAEITELEVDEGGRWLFYSTELQKIFSTRETGNADGDFDEIELTNLPDTNDGDSLPYTSITVKRNLEGTTSLPVVEKDEESSIAIGTRNFKNYFKISDSNTSIPKYRFKLDSNFIISSPALSPKFITRFKDDIES
ncbi:hypothetical protein LCGC14_2920400, partial [marine sediment metagenome]